jgi:hypothetical protein
MSMVHIPKSHDLGSQVPGQPRLHNKTLPQLPSPTTHTHTKEREEIGDSGKNGIITTKRVIVSDVEMQYQKKALKQRNKKQNMVYLRRWILFINKRE